MLKTRAGRVGSIGKCMCCLPGESCFWNQNVGALLALWSRFVVVGQCASGCYSMGDVALLCCVLNRTDRRVLSPGQMNVVYLTTLVVLCEWWDDY